MLLSMWERLEPGKRGTQGSLYNTLGQPGRGRPPESALQVSFIHLGLSDFPLEFRQLHVVLSLGQSHGTERMCPCLSPSIKRPWGHKAAETGVETALMGHV